jgi:hypothetical protein
MDLGREKRSSCWSQNIESSGQCGSELPHSSRDERMSTWRADGSSYRGGCVVRRSSIRQKELSHITGNPIFCSSARSREQKNLSSISRTQAWMPCGTCGRANVQRPLWHIWTLNFSLQLSQDLITHCVNRSPCFESHQRAGDLILATFAGIMNFNDRKISRQNQTN